MLVLTVSDVIANDLAGCSDIQPSPSDYRHVPIQQALLAARPCVPQLMHVLNPPLLDVGLRIGFERREFGTFSKSAKLGATRRTVRPRAALTTRFLTVAARTTVHQHLQCLHRLPQLDEQAAEARIKVRQTLRPLLERRVVTSDQRQQLASLLIGSDRRTHLTLAFMQKPPGLVRARQVITVPNPKAQPCRWVRIVSAAAPAGVPDRTCSRASGEGQSVMASVSPAARIAAGPRPA
jgi:hypothetical protein